MMLSQWSPRRMAAVWAVGLAFQVVVLIVAPAAFVWSFARRDAPRIHQRVIEQNARMKIGEQADSVSRVEQIATARAAGQFRVAANGDTMFAIVSMQPDPQRTAALRRSMERTVDVLVGIQFGAIPLALIGLTFVWFLARRQAGGLDETRRVA